MKYHNLLPVRHARQLPKALSRGCERVEARTGATAYFDLYRGSVCFGYERGGSVSMLDILVPGRSKFDPALDKLRVNGVILPCSVDECVRLINMARIDTRIKDTWAKWHENSRRSDEDRKRDQMIEDGREEVARLVARRRERQSMGRHYKGRSVVNGLKS